MVHINGHRTIAQASVLVAEREPEGCTQTLPNPRPLVHISINRLGRSGHNLTSASNLSGRFSMRRSALALLLAATALAAPLHAQVTTPKAMVSIYRAAPGQQVALLKWLARQDE